MTKESHEDNRINFPGDVFPSRNLSKPCSQNEEAALEYCRLQKMSEGNIALSPNGDTRPTASTTSNKIMNEDRFADTVRDLLLQRVYSRLQKAD